jgi:hypothetical protein
MKKMKQIEVYSLLDPSKLLGIVVKQASSEERINLTPASEILQVSHLNFKNRSGVAAHSHKKIDRNTSGTQEIWIIVKGKALVNFYDTDNDPILTTIVRKNNIVILFNGGHALQKLTRSLSLIEIKNGPYLGLDTNAI